MPQADQIQNLQGKVRSMLVALVFKVCNLLGILAKKTCMTVTKTFRGRGGCYTQAKTPKIGPGDLIFGRGHWLHQWDMVLSESLIEHELGAPGTKDFNPLCLEPDI